ncbi:TRAPP trafficking subunit Trs65-domain-containing protein [Pseudomassariella vexata]|uniref:TRAPP trafficking subunit Trs65-domain-containing protein n=1 Tax=Pseudomassariella vexata TaxID=1141098 RepID=A0A1Y2DS73_9PEZI|nr:TRAPP trafficking subunit Trs65-domain-containing protein [Pseudomassariella vexata]ORY62107.1 TRAPP trafficking subunit Trs65-domain-containing protein [Pseudomassariella vexata]
MAESTMQPGSMSEMDLIDGSGLTYFVPLTTDLKLEEALKTAAESPGIYIESIECRESLLFDESVDVHLVLRTPPVDDRQLDLKSLASRLVISLEVHIVNSNASDRDAPSGSELIFSGRVEDSGGSLIVAGEAADADGNNERKCHRYLVWKLPVFLNRPRMRLQSPSVVFAATASLKPVDSHLLSGRREGYLQSGSAFGLNLLESLGNDPALDGIKPRLSALRVSRVAPITQEAKDLLMPIRAHPKQFSLRIYPAVHSRIRFARPNTTPPSPAIIAMLEIDFTPFFNYEITLKSISMTVPYGVVEGLTFQPEMKLPMSCVAHDHITFLYRVAPEGADMLAKNPTRDLNISIEATALVQPGICTPKLTLSWTSALDFTLPVNPGFGSAMQPIQRAHRPSQLSINSITSLIAPAVARPDALPLMEDASTRFDANVPELGITMTFSAPSVAEKICPGDEFTWTIFVVNRSLPTSNNPPRKLALVAIPKRRRNESRVNRPPSISQPPMISYGSVRPRTPRDRSVADAVLDENIVHAMQKSSIVDSVEMVCLSADVRVGPLPPGACHVVELRFMALKSGIVGMDAVRVIDLGSSEHVDIHDLPTMMVEDPEDEGNGIDNATEGLTAVAA